MEVCTFLMNIKAALKTLHPEMKKTTILRKTCGKHKKFSPIKSACPNYIPSIFIPTRRKQISPAEKISLFTLYNHHHYDSALNFSSSSTANLERETRKVKPAPLFLLPFQQQRHDVIDAGTFRQRRAHAGGADDAVRGEP